MSQPPQNPGPFDRSDSDGGDPHGNDPYGSNPYGNDSSGHQQPSRDYEYPAPGSAEDGDSATEPIASGSHPASAADPGTAQPGEPGPSTQPSSAYSADAPLPPPGYGPSGPHGGGSSTGSKPLVIFGVIGCAILVVAALCTAIALAIAAIVGSAGSDPTPTPTTPVTTAPGQTTTPARPSPTSTAPTKPSDTPSPSAGKKQQGTKDAPLKAGTTVTLAIDAQGGTIDVKLGTPNWNATDAVMKANSFNKKPAADEVYVIVPLTVTHHGPQQKDKFLKPGIELIHGQHRYLDRGVTARPSHELKSLADGESKTVDVAFLVKKADVGDGVIRVSTYVAGAQEAYISVK